MTPSAPISLIALAAILLLAPAIATDYYVAANGRDENDGLSPERPWLTPARVSTADLAPGDTVRFRRGDVWRGQIRPKSGTEGAVVTYTSYGDGPKPVILGSMDLSSPDVWTPVGENLWETLPPEAHGKSVLDTPGAPGAVPWSLYCENGAQATMAYDGATGECRIHCDASGEAGSDIQLIASPFDVSANIPLRIRFEARSTQPARIPGPVLMKAGAPWTSYSAAYGAGTTAVGAEWVEVIRTFDVTVNADDGRLTVFLGGALPAGSALLIRDLSLSPCDLDAVPPVDVGNLIFDNEAECGVKVFEPAQCDAQGKYWYDEGRCVVRLWSDRNPGARYGHIEAALRQHIVDQSGVGYVAYDGLCLKYGAAHGFGGGSTHHITIRNCDLGYIGGGDQMGGDQTVRFGNGIEFWGAAHDCLVENCRLWQIYDAALTNQNLGSVAEEANITYRNNVIWDSEYSFEYWNNPAESVTRNIVFEHNTCVRAGYGWSHAQRPDPSGRHLCFYTSAAAQSEIVIRDNIFSQAREHAFSAQWWKRTQLPSLIMDHNLWFQPEGEVIAYDDARYTMAQFAAYQTELGLDANSLAAEPKLRDAAALDFRLAPGSPGIGAASDGSDIGASGRVLEP